MATTTWSFEDGKEGWRFTDVSNGNASASGAYNSANESLESTLILTGNGAGDQTILEISLSTSIPVQIGDTFEGDFTTPGAQAVFSIITYTDDTTDSTTFVPNPAVADGTIIVTISQNATIKKLEVNFLRQGNQQGVSTYNNELLEVRLITAAPVIATAGRLRTPQDFIEDEGAGAAGGAGGGAGGNIASISADGTFIYIASFNDLGFPTLIKFGTALSADGSVVFNPSTGARVGVQCGRFNADHVWIAGTFGGTDVVEKSEDAGSNFAVKDNGAMGTIRTFEVGPGNDTTVLVFDGDNGDILETIDDGGSWTTINAAVTPLINSLARFGLNPEEIVAGNAGAANDSIDYSPNTGVNLEDYQTGVFPNVDSTKVIAN